MTTMKPVKPVKPCQNKFLELRIKVSNATRLRDEMIQELTAKYGSEYRSCMNRTQEKTLKRLQERVEKVVQRFYDYINAVSPRDWSTGVASYYVTHMVSYADIVTTGELQETPMPAYGNTIDRIRQFMQPVV